LAEIQFGATHGGAHGRHTQVGLPQQHRELRVLVTQSHGLYLNLVVRREYSSPSRIGSPSTTLCAATTRLPAAQALQQLRCAPRLLASRPQRLHLNYAVRPGASRGSSSTTSPMSCDPVPWLLAQLVVDYFTCAMRLALT
jgi:hypothetical protein